MRIEMSSVVSFVAILRFAFTCDGKKPSFVAVFVMFSLPICDRVFYFGLVVGWG